jgi:two-component system response regulator AtoC
MLKVMQQVEMVAPTDSSVLLTGESGTGKEVIARRLHDLSPRRDRPFVAVNCAGLSPALLESEMFGHERGAFTGAVSRQRGRFELADTGTFFLDEVSEVRPELQARLLRVLEERSFERVGGSRTIEVDVRLVAATNKDLQQAMQAGDFREDLFHRLAVFPIHLPALRERPQDILLLAEHLLERVAAKLGQTGLSLSAEARKELGRHSWPGNVRELGNVLERAAILSAGEPIGRQHLLLGPAVQASSRLDGTLKELERKAIRQALLSTGGHRKDTAKRLGIGLRTLYDKLKEYDLD